MFYFKGKSVILLFFEKKRDINTLFCWFQKITLNYTFLERKEKTRRKNLASNKQSHHR
jgi:hypothetical protein